MQFFKVLLKHVDVHINIFFILKLNGLLKGGALLSPSLAAARLGSVFQHPNEVARRAHEYKQMPHEMVVAHSSGCKEYHA